MSTPHEILKKVFGYDTFRKGQLELIEAIASGRDAMGVMPTGAGKSLCYQIPAIMTGGLAVVVSPLISLMKDQVDALRENGVSAATINSAMDWEEAAGVFRAARNGRIRLLYVAPERLEGGFADFLRDAAPKLVVVDEAHCVSHWGHDFRPSYLNIAPVIESLPVRPPVAAFTATATPEVRDDIIAQLGLRGPFSLTTGFDRENLFFHVERPDDKNAAMLRYVAQFPNASGIIYCSTRKTVETVCERLRGKGIKAVRYHAGLSDAERAHNQEEFIHDRAPVMVATNAFGMGIDKSNVRYVLHYNMPQNLDAYYQEAGRAGRDGLPSDCLLLYGARDVVTAKFFISQSPEDTRASANKKLRAMIDYCHTTGCLRAFILNYFGETDAPEKCSACGNCVGETERVDITTEAQKLLSCVYRMAQASGGRRYGISMLVDVIRGSQRAEVKELAFDKISTYGLLKERSAREVRDMADFLIAEGYLSLGSDFPTLSLTKRAMQFFRSPAPLLMRVSEGEKKKAEHIKKRTREISASASEGLFEELRVLRRAIASENGVPPYVVFSDKTLAAICEAMPEDEDDFLEIPGVGAAKLERYGEAFLSVVRDWKRRA
ncbi:DNA helicase RecQ [Cloacibacillus sp. An23]|uniref:DNA helicase RecQ n=1 Tax=Cloacibacillus sp. An23 TaxID=1965591 RepID=UPI000B36C109|nr:DNA helicase RecQ [Cloacibacillus sp. An23]OUO93492.1 DNA helicase RecQ [Cloacibacillus sp. An23]